MAFIDLPDDELLLALCILKEQLDDPSAWCRELRRLYHPDISSPKTTADSEALTEARRCLYDLVKERPPRPTLSTTEEDDGLLAGFPGFQKSG